MLLLSLGFYFLFYFSHWACLFILWSSFTNHLKEKATGCDNGERMALQKPEKDNQHDDDEEDEKAPEEEADKMFYPGWYKHGSWGRTSPGTEENPTNINNLDQMKEDDGAHIEKEDKVQATDEPQINCLLSNSQDSHLMLNAQSHLENKSQSLSQPLSDPNAEENRETDDFQDWVCLPGAVDEGFVSEDSLNKKTQADNGDKPSLPVEGSHCSSDNESSGLDEGISEMKQDEDGSIEGISACGGDVLSNDNSCQSDEENMTEEATNVFEETENEQDEQESPEQPQDPKSVGFQVSFSKNRRII